MAYLPMKKRDRVSQLNKRSFAVFLFILLSFALVFALENSQPQWLSLDLTYKNTTPVTPVYQEGQEIVMGFKVNFTGPTSAATFVKASLGSENRTKLLTELLEHQNISYTTSSGQYAVSTPVTNAEFAFASAGDQQVYLLVDTPKDKFISFEMEVFGFGSPSPKLPYLDFGADGLVEWQFFGDLIGFTDAYTLPNTLAENEAGSIKIKDNSKANLNYYCEEIDLPYTRDVEVYAKMKDLGTGAKLKAAILQLEVPGCTGSNCIASGGQYACDMPTNGTNTSKYYGCAINLGYAIKDDFLVCVYNDVDGTNNVNHAELSTESGKPNSAYTCKVSGSEYKCSSVDNDDFFIKVKGGKYTEVLQNANANFTAGLVNSYQAFIDNLNNKIEDCIELDSGGCAIPLKVGSLSKGVLSLQSLKMEYLNGALTKSKSIVYMQLDADDGSIVGIDTIDLLEDTGVVSFDTSGLYLYAPATETSKNFTLEISLSPGPKNSTKVQVNPGAGNVTSSGLNMTSAKGYINEYIAFLNSQKSEYGDILEALGYGSAIEKALDELGAYYTKATAVNVANQTAINSFTKNLSKELDTIMKNLPNKVDVVNDVSEILVTEEDDILDFMINDPDKKSDAYYFQNDFLVQGRARYVKVETFKGDKKDGTFIEKEIVGKGSNYYVYEVIPQTIVKNPGKDVDFTEDFSLFKTTPEGVYKKQYSSLNGLKYSYFVESNIASKLSELKTILIPVSGEVSQGSENVPVCGDGKCSVLVVDGDKIYLEDATSCPEDCSKKINWTAIFMVFMIGIMIIVAVVLYFKYFKKGEQKSRDKTQSTKTALFSNTTDEAKLRDYVAKTLASGKKKEEIIDLLLKKGWKREQLEHVFKALPKK